MTCGNSGSRFQMLCCAMSLCLDMSGSIDCLGKNVKVCAWKVCIPHQMGSAFLKSTDSDWLPAGHVTVTWLTRFLSDVLVRWHTGADVAVCTIEKASTLLNRLLEEGSDWSCVLLTLFSRHCGTMCGKNVPLKSHKCMIMMTHFIEISGLCLSHHDALTKQHLAIFGNRDCVWFGNGSTLWLTASEVVVDEMHLLGEDLPGLWPLVWYLLLKDCLD
jgi:hypothetical protein